MNRELNEIKYISSQAMETLNGIQENQEKTRKNEVSITFKYLKTKQKKKPKN